MKKALVMCRTGMGSSMILVTKLKKVIAENNFPLLIEHDVVSSSYGHDADLIITMSDLISEFENSGIYIIGIKDIMDKDYMKKELEKYFNQET